MFYIKLVIDVRARHGILLAHIEAIMARPTHKWHGSKALLTMAPGWQGFIVRAPCSMPVESWTWQYRAGPSLQPVLMAWSRRYRSIREFTCSQ